MRRTAIRRVSKKRAAALKLYSAAKNHFLGNYRPCECHGVQNPCPNKATEVHHMNRRAGDMLLDTRYWLPVCSPCHFWIESNKKEARKLGMILYK